MSSSFVSPGEVARLVEKRIEMLAEEDNTFRHILEDQDLKRRLIEDLTKALAGVRKEVVNDPEFNKKFLLAFKAALLVEKSPAYEQKPALREEFREQFQKHLGVLFKKDDMNQNDYRDELKLLLTDILTARNAEDPPHKQLNADEIAKIVDKIMEDEDPEKELFAILDELAELQLRADREAYDAEQLMFRKNEKVEQDEEKQILQMEAEEDARLRNEARLEGGATHKGVVMLEVLQGILPAFRGVSEGPVYLPTSRRAQTLLEDPTKVGDPTQNIIRSSEKIRGVLIDDDQLLEKLNQMSNNTPRLTPNG